jgi:hypothetical protein
MTATNPTVRLSNYNPLIVELARELSNYRSSTPVRDRNVNFESEITRQANRVKTGGGDEVSFLAIVMQGSPNTKINGHWADTYAIIE